MKIILTTSDKYHHLLPISTYLFNKYWSKENVSYHVEIVGYEKPNFELPDNFTFYSLGKQIGDSKNFSTDLRLYFEKQDEFFIWMFDDTFIKSPVDFDRLELLMQLNTIIDNKIGRINLSAETVKQDHRLFATCKNYTIYCNTKTANYRLSTQPSIWNKEFLLKYLTPRLSPWDFEKQDTNDDYLILGMSEPAVNHNEGVTKKNIHEYDLNGIDKEVIDEMRELKYI